MRVSAIGSGASAQLLQSLFSKADSDKSGGISLDELGAASKTLQTGQSDAVVARAFDAMDSDDSGTVSESELKTAFDKLSSEMRSTLLDTQEGATGDTLGALIDTAAAPVEASAAAGGPPPGGGGGGGGPGGAGGGTKGSGEDEESTDPADLNGDGIVTASEQAAYDAGNGATATASTAATSAAAA